MNEICQAQVGKAGLHGLIEESRLNAQADTFAETSARKCVGLLPGDRFREHALDGGALAAGCAVDGFDEGDGFTAFGAVADGLAVGANGVEKVFDDFLVAADVGDSGG